MTILSGPDVKLVCEDCVVFEKFLSKNGAVIFNVDHLTVPYDLMVRIDSLLSCLKHRHGSMMEKIGEYQEIYELNILVQKYTRRTAGSGGE